MYVRWVPQKEHFGEKYGQINCKTTFSPFVRCVFLVSKRTFPMEFMNSRCMESLFVVLMTLRLQFVDEVNEWTTDNTRLVPGSLSVLHLIPPQTDSMTNHADKHKNPNLELTNLSSMLNTWKSAPPSLSNIWNFQFFI